MTESGSSSCSGIVEEREGVCGEGGHTSAHLVLAATQGYQ